MTQKPDTTEDLTTAWTEAGPTRLGQPTTVGVPPGQTLVAFLVGTQLNTTAGTSTGSCTATRDGRPVDLSWPVQIDRSLTGVLTDGQQTVAIAGWTNNANSDVRIEIRCSSADSGVNHYVAIPTRSAVLTKNPWFQPWGWIALATVGVGLIVSGWQWISPPSR
jgi:glycogen debranching enzyme